jgi:type VI secretion system protein ImpC
MSDAQAQGKAAAAAVGEAQPGLLDQVLSNTPSTPKDKARELVDTLITRSLEGTVSWSKNVRQTLQKHIDAIDDAISRQLTAIMHDPKFQQLEGTWRGLRYLVFKAETGTTLQIRMLNASKKDVAKDLATATEFDQSNLWRKINSDEYNIAGGKPYGVMIGDYAWDNDTEDLETLTGLSQVAAGAHCPFISSPSAQFFGFESFQELSRPRDLENDMSHPVNYLKWNAFRATEDSRWVTMAMPRVLARVPFGSAPSCRKVEEFDFEEVPRDSASGKGKSTPHNQFCWMNAAYVLAERLTNAFSKYGWCTAIRGAEGGGKVEGLPVYTFKSDDGDPDLKCPTEIGITDSRENELGKCGFLPLVHYKNTDYAVFFGGQSTQKPKKYDNAAGTANAAISARLPYLMASSRMAHYLKVIGRDKIGSFMETSDVQDWLNRWIAQYICADPKPTQDMKAKYPLAEAKIQVEAVPGAPGSYRAIAWLRPWLQLEELTTSLRMVANIPKLEK